MSTFLDFNFKPDDEVVILPFDASKLNARENAASNKRFLEGLGRALDNITEAAGPWLSSRSVTNLVKDAILEDWVSFWIEIDALLSYWADMDTLIHSGYFSTDYIRMDHED